MKKGRGSYMQNATKEQKAAVSRTGGFAKVDAYLTAEQKEWRKKAQEKNGSIMQKYAQPKVKYTPWRIEGKRNYDEV